jgi:hypothetical protein
VVGGENLGQGMAKKTMARKQISIRSRVKKKDVMKDIKQSGVRPLVYAHGEAVCSLLAF